MGFRNNAAWLPAVTCGCVGIRCGFGGIRVCRLRGLGPVGVDLAGLVRSPAHEVHSRGEGARAVTSEVSAWATRRELIRCSTGRARRNAIVLLAQGSSAKRARRLHRSDKKPTKSLPTRTSPTYIFRVATLRVPLWTIQALGRYLRRVRFGPHGRNHRVLGDQRAGAAT
jgi:hypothetical protein